MRRHKKGGNFMDRKKLNMLASDFKETPTDEIFNEIYRLISSVWEKKVATIANSLRADEHETTSLYEDALLRCLKEYDGIGDFLNFYVSSAARLRTNLYNKKKRLRSKEYLFEKQIEDDENAPTFEVIDESENVEKKVMEADQRQLIDFLLSKANARTTAIVKAFLDDEPITAIAKSLGINHHETVNREIRKLAKNHEPSQFGDYHDFLAS
jgi:DNA-directed RNA polymerase specialized sigma24 family protein